MRVAKTGAIRPAAASRMRWYIASLLFLSTVINYIDRQTLNILGPQLKSEFGWTNADFAWLVIAFRIAYGGGQMFSGRLLDRLGTRTGLSLTVVCYSTIAALTSLATGLRSFAGFRFLLGAAESANWPGATKAVSEWFSPRESGWAVAFFDSGSSIGAAIAPFLVLAIVHLTGSWRPAFVVARWDFCGVAVSRDLSRRSRSPVPDASAGVAAAPALPYARSCGCRRPGGSSSARR